MTLEILANLMVTLSIVLAGRNSIHTWWTGIVGCALIPRNEYKRRQAPPIVRVRARAFGTGRQMPIAARY
jgi:hypothetical protein